MPLRSGFPFGVGLVVVLAAWFGAVPLDASAQRDAGAVGVGGEVGRPAGLTAKLYRPDLVAYDLLLTTDGDDFLVGYVHRVWERPLPQSPLHAFVGPGLVGGTERDGGPVVAVLGVGGLAGLNFYAERFEVFLQVTPRVRFLPHTEGILGGSVGLRYYFWR